MNGAHRVVYPIRVEFITDSLVITSCVGLESYISCGAFDFNMLPDEAKRKISVLMMMSYDPPTEQVKGVGRRMSKNIYWLEGE